MTRPQLRTGYRTACVAAIVAVALVLGATSLNPMFNFWR